MSANMANNKFHRLLDAIAETVLTASNDEIVEDLKVQGQDPASTAKEIRAALLASVLVHKKSKLLEAQKRHAQQVEALGKRSLKLPDTASGRRALLEKVLRLIPQYRPAVLTAQYRDFSELTDDDVLQHLMQFAQLGALDDPKITADE